MNIHKIKTKTKEFNKFELNLRTLLIKPRDNW